MSKFTPKKRDFFLSALAAGQSVTAAAEQIGLTRQAMYKAKAANQGFARLWEEAIEAGTDILEDEAVRRAKDGSDVLLIFLLKARRPDKYRENIKHEQSGQLILKVQYGDDGNQGTDG